MTEAKDDIMLSAAPTDDEIRRWQALPRDEQLRRMQRALDEAMASGLSERSMDEIKEIARQRLRAKASKPNA